MKYTIPAILILIAFAQGAGTAHAKGFYAGAGIGNTFFSEDFSGVEYSDTKIDENSTAWKIFGGIHGLKFLGIEGGYRDFGKIESLIETTTIRYKITGWDIEALGKLQISIVQVFAKAGIMFYDLDTNVAGTSSETDFIWGLGAGVALGPIGVRLEWESLEAGQIDNLSMLSLGATFGF